MIHKFFSLTKENWSLLIILSAVFLFATKTSFNIPMYIMACTGLYRLIKNGTFYKSPSMHFIFILFFSLWLPMLFSLTDAVALPHSLKTTLPYLRFLFAAYFIVDEVQKKSLHNKLIIGIVIIVSFWCLDALFQFFVGVDIFTYPIYAGYADGLFSPKGTSGHILAILSPIYFEFLRRHHSKHKYLWLLLLLLFVIVFLGGKRTAWMMLLSSCGMYSLYLFHIDRSAALKAVLMIPPIIALTLGLFLTQNQLLQNRVNITMGLFSGDYAATNIASSKRLPLWKTGINTYQAHKINGVGPRGFRHVYDDFSSPDDLLLVTDPGNKNHPHLILLEIMVETGLLGLLGYIIFWLYLFRLSFQLIKANNAHHLPWLMCIMIATLPYNAGLAFYGSYWSSITWWVILVAASFVFSNHGRKI